MLFDLCLNLRLGDQAEITFTFEGEAPFSFSYTRSEEGGKGREGKVVETHVRPTFLLFSSPPRFFVADLSCLNLDGNQHPREPLLDLRFDGGNMASHDDRGSLVQVSLSSFSFPPFSSPTFSNTPRSHTCFSHLSTRYPPLAGAGPSSSEPLKMLEGIDLFPPLTGS